LVAGSTHAIIAVRTVRDALVQADPGGRDSYVAGAGAYLAQVACYYADRYGIEVIGTVIPALSAQAQASAGEVTRLVRTIRDARVSTIFSESSVNPKLTRAIAREAGAQVGPALYADSLGAKGTQGATYVGSLQANTRALVQGFSG
jgi:ABC-type Zn uptake system ZnuABC Zn-binding protein ZnuA